MRRLSDILKVYEENKNIIDDTTIELEFYCADEGANFIPVAARYDAVHNRIVINIRSDEND